MFARAMFKPELLRARHPGPQHSLAALRAVGSNWRPRAASSCRLMLPTTPRKLDTHPVRPTLPSCCVAHYLVPSFELMTTNTANTVEAASHWHTPHHNIPIELIMSRRASPARRQSGHGVLIRSWRTVNCSGHAHCARIHLLARSNQGLCSSVCSLRRLREQPALFSCL